MKHSSVLTTALCFLAVIIVNVASTLGGTRIRDIRLLELAQVNTQAPSPVVRLLSYRTALSGKFPEIDASSFDLAAEVTDSIYGVTVQLVQKHLGVKVIGSNAWLRTDLNDKATWGGIDYYAGIDLTNESFLADVNNQEALRLYAGNFCPDYDSIEFVDPTVYPIVDSISNTIMYAYALVVTPFAVGPGRIVDWKTGVTLEQLPAYATTISGSIYIPVKTQSENDQRNWISAQMGLRVASDYGDQGGPLCAVSGCSWCGYDDYDYTYVDGYELEVGQLSGFSVKAEATTEPWCSYTPRFGQFVRQSIDFPVWANVSLGTDPILYPEQDFYFEDRADLGTATNYLLKACDVLEYYTGTSHYNYYPCKAVVRSDEAAGDDSAKTWYSGMSMGGDPNEIADDWPVSTIVFGRMRNRMWAEYRDIISHEAAHVAQFRWYGARGITGPLGEACAEGLADFFAAASSAMWGSGNGSTLEIPGQTGPVNYCIAPSTISYYDYSPSFSARQNGQILSAALWDWRNLVVQSGLHGSEYYATSWVVNKVLGAHLATPSNFGELVYQIATHLDAGDGLENGWGQDGQLMYQAFYLNHRIPCSPSDYSAVDGWAYYRCQNNHAEMLCSSITGLDPSGTANLVQGTNGLYATYYSSIPSTDDEQLVVSRLIDAGSSWTSYIINRDPKTMQREATPSIALAQQGGRDDLLISWLWENGNYSAVSDVRMSFSGNECDDYSYTDVHWQSPQYRCTPPATVSHGLEVARFCGRKNSWQGLPTLQYRKYHGTSYTDGSVTGVTNGIDEVAADARSGSDLVHVAWISNDHVYYRMGVSDYYAGYIWTASTTQEVSDPGITTSRKNVSVAWSPSIKGIVIAWQEYQDGEWVIKWNRAQCENDQQANPIFLNTPLTVAYPGVNLRTPNVHSYCDNLDNVQEGHARIGLSYEVLFLYDTPWHGQDSIVMNMFTGLQVNELLPNGPFDMSQWQWLPPMMLGWLRSPSITSWVGDANMGGFGHLSLVSVGQPVVLYNQLNLVYSPLTPTALSEDLIVSEPLTLITPVGINRKIVVQSGGELRIICPSQQEIEDRRLHWISGTGIIVEDGGILTIQGASQNPITMQGYDTSSWSGIKVEAGGRLEMQYVNMFDTDSFCVYAEKPGTEGGDPITIQNCYFDGRKLVEGAHALRVIGCTDAKVRVEGLRIDTLAPGSSGLYLQECFVEFRNDTISSSYRTFDGKDSVDVTAWGNAFLENVTGEFNQCVFRGRTDMHGMLFTGEPCTPQFYCCLFENLTPTDWITKYDAPIYANRGTAPIFGFYDETAANVISDSSFTLMHMFGTKVLPIIDYGVDRPGGRNDWIQQAQTYNIYWEESTGDQYWAQYQYWLRDNPSLYFYPSGQYQLGGANGTPWGLCGSQSSYSAAKGTDDHRTHDTRGNTGLDDVDDDYVLFRDGLTLEAAGQYAEAQATFMALATSTLNANLRWQAITHVLSTQRHLNSESQSSAWIPALIDSAVALQSTNYDALFHGKRLLASYYLTQQNYPQAVGITTTLLNSGLAFNDSILVALDLVGIQMLMDAQDDSSTSLDNNIPNAVPAELRVSSVEQGLRVQRQLLGVFGSGTTKSRPAPIPQTYRLYQNYPNPFNPNTEIKFDLPEAVKVQVKIFNTLGQEVATLVDGMRPAGSHSVIWDSKSASGVQVASGVYVYQIKAGNFVDSKKMVLIR